ncbi:MAG: ABC transporter ATP-binding protein [Methylobacteriaceae bacterium]|nr:ABC transporter ATP-binding protein [Methylobacteriaceae bacterium]
MLEMQGVTAGYEGVPVLRDVSVNVGRGELVGLLGANNAGKSTLINVISGIVPIMSGRLMFDGEDISRVGAQRRVELGLVQVPEGRHVFPQMSVRENLLLGGYNRKARPERGANMDHVVSLFPRLGERLGQLAGTLSGGEQQMVAIGRGLMAGARVLMLDEPSLGLSPLFVQFIFEIIDKLHAEGMTILLVEQNLSLTVRHADRCYVLERGVVAVEGASATVADDPRTRAAYLGM